MGRISSLAVTRIALALGLAAACSEGASPSAFPPYPPAPVPSSSDGGQATIGSPTGGETAGAGDCCVANGSPGCNNVEIEACVCAELTSCCSDGWTVTCAGLVDDLGCGQCGGPLETGEADPDGTAGGNGQSCCSGGPLPGCDDPVVEACVCDEIAFCCDTGWEKVCGSAVEALGCGHCGGMGETGDPPPPPGGSTGGDPPPPPPPAGGCCDPAMTPGCTDAVVQDCVCMDDPYCCDTAWDEVCVDAVDMLGCGSCGGMPPPGVSPCCEAQPGPGCGDPAIADCVCFIDDYCCNVEWDATCAIFVELFLCGSC